MSYKVHYGTSRHDGRTREAAVRKWIPLILLIALLTGGFLLTRQGVSFDWLLPGDPGVTAAALENLRENLAAGEPLGEAVTAFCREIIDGAALAE